MTKSTDRKLSFKKAAQKILSDSDEPLSAKETAIALEKNLIRTEGKTPQATMVALIYMDIKDNKKNLPESRQRKVLTLTGNPMHKSPLG